MTDDPTPTATPPEGGKATDKAADKAADVFTQADVDRIVTDRLTRERAKFADYDDLRAKAEGAKTAEDRITELEKSIETATREAMRRRVQAAHSISDEDAELFLTGKDEESLKAQAKRLADRESERKNKNNVSPREGNPPKSGGTDDLREFARDLFATARQD